MTKRSKKQQTIRIAIQLFVAALLSILVTQTSSLSPVSPCVHTAGCLDSSGLTGMAIIQQRGYPVPYREVSIFEPTNQNHYAVTSLNVHTAGSSHAFMTVLIDITFWYALLEVVFGSLLSAVRRRASKTSISTE